MTVQPLGQRLVHRHLDQRADLGVTQLGLGLSLELRLPQLDRNDAGQSLADVLTGEVLVLLLEEPALSAEVVDRPGERLAHALLVGTAFVGVDVVGERQDRFRVSRGPLHRQVEFAIVPGLLERDDVGVERLALGVEVLHEVDDASGVPERVGRFGIGPLVDQMDLQAFVEERHLAKSGGDDLVVEFGRLLEDLFRGEKGHRRAGALGRLPLLERRGGLSHLEGLRPRESITDHRHVEPAGECIDDRDPDAVQATRHRVCPRVELAAGVQGGEHRGDRGELGLGNPVYGDAAAVVLHRHRAVAVDLYVHPGAMPRHRLVDRVVDHLPHEVVQSARSGRPDVHRRPFAYCLESLEDRNVLGVVGRGSSLRRRGGCLGNPFCGRSRRGRSRGPPRR